ncbi:hypothetical protein BDB01DRAFT_36516 [Pilobolus umbonatus]|nr:hypothetical protein BDB01DRAFT_36516 [Pilobolus umbonatus]
MTVRRSFWGELYVPLFIGCFFSHKILRKNKGQKTKITDFYLTVQVSSVIMAEQPPQRTRLTKSKATSSTTAIQTLEITTTAIVTSVNDKHTIGSPTDNNDNTTRDNTKEITRDINKDTHVNDTDNTLDNNNTDLYRKQSHHHHRHHIRSPGFEAGSTLPSPLTSQNNEHLLPADISLPPPIVKGPSEAIVALQDAANDLSNKKSIKRCPPDLALFDSSFFSAALLIQWSNLMGPKVERVWSVEPLEERVQMLIGRQVLNGEMGRSIKEVEPKWIILHKQGIICTAFLYNDPTIQSLCAFVLVVPIRYLKNFSQYFNVLCDRVPYQLVEVLIKLRMIHRKCSISWPNTLNFFTLNRLMPFVKSIMDLESVSLPAECIKTNHTILDQESRQMLESPFIAKFSHHVSSTDIRVLVIGG